MDATNSLLLVLFAPLTAACFIAFFCRQRPQVAIALSLSAAGVIFVASLMATLQFTRLGDLSASMEWLRLGDFVVNMGLLLDNTAATMLMMVSFVGLLIHVFSVGYMRGDAATARFFGGLSIFMFSMLGIVLADNLVMLFVFWELVGFSSYMLIGHYIGKDEAAQASKKAFIVNRVGDLGFLLGIVFAYWHFGTSQLTELAAAIELNPALINGTIAALLMCGFIGKSAQFPLHVWLPDAMAGPTPVSALIHAATMVAAGVYFLIRIVFLFPLDLLPSIAWLGVAVALYAGFCAFAQSDIKRILAYSTLSQLGYMAAIFGLGYPGLALFHLITHAFFKALLFLGAGSVIHGCHHEQNIFKMGGLFRKMPITSVTFLIGLLALCGVYGLSGFYSKDAILIAAGLHSTPIFVLLALGALLTAGYMGRLFWIAFLGRPNSPAAEGAHESGPAMLLPLVILALLSIAGGWLNVWPLGLGEIIQSDQVQLHAAANYDAMHSKVVITGSLACLVGLLLALFFYRIGAQKDRLQTTIAPLYAFLESRLWFDEIYNFYVQKIQQRAALLLSFLDVSVLKGLCMRGSAGLVALVSLLLRMLHTGNLHNYVAWFLAGVLLLSAFAFACA